MRVHGPGSTCIHYKQNISPLNTHTPNRKGTYPRIVSRMLIRKSVLQPEIKKTPSGGTICESGQSLVPRDKISRNIQKRVMITMHSAEQSVILASVCSFR
jgi:hypothetical protein